MNDQYAETWGKLDPGEGRYGKSVSEVETRSI